MARPVTPPRIAEPGGLMAIDLGDAGLHDELELEDVHVTGEARELSVRNLELSAALLDDVDLAGGRLARLALRNCRIAGGSLTNVSVRAGSAERCAFVRVRLTGVLWHEGVLRAADFSGARLASGCELRGCELEGARGVERLRGVRMPYTDVLAAATIFAGALGIEIIAGDEDDDRGEP